jgi:hypothetical protein
MFWDVSLADISEEPAAPCVVFCHEDGSNKFLRNVGNYLSDYTALLLAT